MRILLEQLDPPAGRLRRGDVAEQPAGRPVEQAGVAEVRFVGWLGLLAAMDRMIGRDRGVG